MTEMTMMKISGQLYKVYVFLIKKSRVELCPFAHEHWNFCHADVALLKKWCHSGKDVKASQQKQLLQPWLDGDVKSTPALSYNAAMKMEFS